VQKVESEEQETLAEHGVPALEVIFCRPGARVTALHVGGR